MTANAFAYVALASWPVIGLTIFFVRPLREALIWNVLIAYLLLPVGAEIKIEGVPALDKSTIPNFVALLGCVLVTRRFPRMTRGFGAVEVLILAFLLGPFITSALNEDPISRGSLIIPGVSQYDALSAAVAQFIILIPFLLGRAYLRDLEDNSMLLRLLAVAGAAYTIPMLFEVRMSPQLHNWIYGYFPHSFEQQMRDGGFRPVVFLGHGLLVAFFAMTTAVAVAAHWRIRQPILRLPSAALAGYLGVVIVLCKTLGALVYGALLVPLVRFGSTKLQFRVATILVVIALVYPLLRATDTFPNHALLEAAGAVSSDRARSLKVRFDQEEALLGHASNRIWFGWGRWGRSRVYDETGKDVSLTDGRWVLVLGTFGVIGFVAEFGLLALCVVRAASAARYATSTRDAIFLAALALIVAINVLDLLPNSSLRPWTWLLAGALLGRAEALRIRATTKMTANYSSPHPALIVSRDR